MTKSSDPGSDLELIAALILGEVTDDQRVDAERRLRENPGFARRLRRAEAAWAELRSAGCADLDDAAAEPPAEFLRRARRAFDARLPTPAHRGPTVAVAGTARIPRPARMRWAAAAAILAALGGAAWWAATVDRRDAEVLVAAVENLARKDPDAFAGFRALDLDELSRIGAARVVRGGELTLLGPVGATPSTAPRYVWRCAVPVADGIKWDIGLERISSGPPPEPDDPAGWGSAHIVHPAHREAGDYSIETDALTMTPGSTYVWTLTVPTAIDSLRVSAKFRVMDETAALTYDRALRTIDSTAPAGVRDLLKSHYALTRDPPVTGDAYRFARAFAASSSSDPLGAATLNAILGSVASPSDGTRER